MESVGPSILASLTAVAEQAVTYGQPTLGASTWLDGLGVVVMASLLVVGCALAWAFNWIGLPGNWLAIACMAGYAWLGPEEGRAAIGMPVLVGAFLLALLGEVVEFVAGAAGASRAGASRRATLFSIFGSMGGALLGALIGLPVPVLGPILAAILFGGFGAMGGAVYAEWTDGRPWRETWEIGWAAFLGRTFGTLGKSLFGLLIVVLCLLAVCF